MIEVAILAPEELQKERLDICSNCEFYKESFGINVCDVCGCYMSMKVKIKQLECPKGKW
jgi:hypothetical protein